REALRTPVPASQGAGKAADARPVRRHGTGAQYLPRSCPSRRAVPTVLTFEPDSVHGSVYHSGAKPVMFLAAFDGRFRRGSRQKSRSVLDTDRTRKCSSFGLKKRIRSPNSL